MTTMNGDIKLGVIGGTGLYEMPALEIVEERVIDTPFGEPSDAITIGRMNGIGVAFLPRHGKGHRILPSELNFRANIWSLKSLGVDTIISVSAVGSLKHEYVPTHLLVPDQFIDRTRHRVDTFFGEGLVAHIAFADPICSSLAELIASSAESIPAIESKHPESPKLHRGGTYVCMEGPQFSTRAESNLYRSWGADVIGMTNLQEAKLAREAEICYATLALITDYDCWHEGHDDVDGAAVLEVLRKNSAVAQDVLAAAIGRFAGDHHCACGCHQALELALVTPRELIPTETYQRVKLLVGKYYEAEDHGQ